MSELTFLNEQFHKEEYLDRWVEDSNYVIGRWEEDESLRAEYRIEFGYARSLLKDPLSFDVWLKYCLRIEKYTEQITKRQQQIADLVEDDDQSEKEALAEKLNHKIKVLERAMLKYEIITLC